MRDGTSAGHHVLNLMLLDSADLATLQLNTSFSNSGRLSTMR